MENDLKMYDSIYDKIGFNGIFNFDYFDYSKWCDIITKYINKSVFLKEDIKVIYEFCWLSLQIIPVVYREKARKIFIEKNNERGGGWKDVALVGSLIEIHAKILRLSHKSNDEDSLIDLFNYLILVMMCIEIGSIKKKRSETVIITGDDGCLGSELKEVFLLNGFTVIEYGTKKNYFEIELFFRWLKDTNVKVNYLVNNYGVNKLNWIGEIQFSDYQTIDVNLKLPIMVINELVKQNLGPTRILNICSQTYRIPQRCTSIYCSSKAGMAHLTKVMARELAPKGYVVNAIAPGKIKGTKMSELTDKQVLELRGWSRKNSDEYAKKLIPMGRYTTKAEVSEAVLKILDLPSYINGTVIDMTGGQ